MQALPQEELSTTPDLSKGNSVRKSQNSLESSETLSDDSSSSDCPKENKSIANNGAPANSFLENRRASANSNSDETDESTVDLDQTPHTNTNKKKRKTFCRCTDDILVRLQVIYTREKTIYSGYIS